MSIDSFACGARWLHKVPKEQRPPHILFGFAGDENSLRSIRFPAAHPDLHSSQCASPRNGISQYHFGLTGVAGPRHCCRGASCRVASPMAHTSSSPAGLPCDQAGPVRGRSASGTRVRCSPHHRTPPSSREVRGERDLIPWGHALLGGIWDHAGANGGWCFTPARWVVVGS